MHRCDTLPLFVSVLSGKGGVGKTTISVNLALALRQLGYSVGLLDLDVYGPNTHLVLGLPEAPPMEDARVGRLRPAKLEKHGIEYMSVATVFPEGTGLALRADYVLDIVRTFIEYTEWSSKIVVVDMPPGSQDVVNYALRLLQGRTVAVLVIEPHRFAAADSLRLYDILRYFNIRLKALVLNKANLFTKELIREVLHEMLSRAPGLRQAKILAIPWDSELASTGLKPSLFTDLARAVVE